MITNSSNENKQLMNLFMNAASINSVWTHFNMGFLTGMCS